jgi:hypothetical protein
MAFDENKYKAIFEARYGSGSFESGLSQAREIGRSKVQADLAKQQMKKVRKETEAKAKKKTYDDALTYWNDPANKEHLLGRGVHNLENDYLNDPREKARVKELGFTKEDYIDAMHSASTNGTARSKREKKQQQKNQNFNVSDEKTDLIPRPKETKKANTTKATTSTKLLPTNPKKKATKNKKKEDTTLWDDVKAAGKTAYQAFNPFDDVSMEDAVKNYTTRNTSKAFDEIARGSNRAVDSASLGIMSNLDKKVNNREPYYNSKREFGEGSGTDMITSGLGYLVPGVGGYKALNATKAGKSLTQFGSKGIGQRLASEGAKGAIIGAGMSGAEVGAREGLNPDDYNWKQNLGYIGMNTALGAVADPLLYGAGKGIAKGFESASSRTMQNLLPSSGQIEGALKSFAKSNQADNALPIKSRNLYDDLIPKGNNIANPNYVPSVTSKPKLQVEVPQIGNPTDQQIKLTEGQINEWKPIVDEFEQAVEQQYQYLKGSMGKGVEYGSTGSGPGNFKEVNGGFRISNNPKWYQDFYRQNGRKPTNAELRELAEVHVREGFQDEVGNLPAWQPKRVQEIDNEIEDIVDAIRQNPEQEELLQPILQGLEEDKAAILGDLETAFTELPALRKQQADILGTTQLPEQTAVKPTRTVINDTQQAQPINQPNTPEPIVKSVEQPVNGPTQPLRQPENVSYAQGERKHYSTLTNSEKASDEFINGIKNLDRSYTKISDQEVVDFANGMVGRNVEEAFQFVKNTDRFDKRHTAVGARLLDVLQQNKEFERAVDLADILAKEGTKAGQSLQSFSIYNRLSAQGQLIRAQRRVNKLNQTLPEGKKVVLTPDIAEDIVATADSIQKLTGQQDIGNNVISLLEKAKKGNTLTDDELKSVHSFMSDAKKFVGDIDPKAKPGKVKPVKDARSRDKVVDFMAKQEAEAKKRIEARRNRANSLPVDIFYDYVVIGASKIAKGTVKFSDFSEQMIKDLGEEVRPYMQQIYNKAVENFNITSEKITPTRLSQAEKIVNKAMTNKSLSQTEADELMDLTKRLVNAAGDSKYEASMNLQVVLNKLEQPTFAQMLSSTHYQAMLLNPLTVMRNIIGNEVFYRVDRASKLLAVPIDIARSKLTGGQRTIVFNTGQFQWGNFMNPTKDYGKGMKLGAKAGWKGVNPLGINTAYDIKSPAFSSEASNLGLLKKAFVSKFNPLHWTEKVLGVTMRSFDTAGYMRAYNQALREQATLKAVNEGLKGRALQNAAERYFLQADDNMVSIAEQYGKYATFQDNTALARGLTKFKDGLNELSTKAVTLGTGQTKEFGAGSFIMPFPKTPANLVMRALEYSPAGLIRSANLIKTYTKSSKNPLDLREGQIAFSRAIMGTAGFSGFGYILADKGVLTSAGNSDYEVKELEKMAGKQPNSVNITAIQRFITSGLNLDELELKEGDTFVSYDWMQPIALSVSLGTGINQADKESDNPTVGERAIRAGDSALNTIVNMSSLQGINRLVSGPPNETWSEKVAGSMQSAGGSFVPTLVNQFRKATDNTARNTNDPTFKEKFENMARNKVPGYNKLLPPSYNTFGEKKELYPNNTNNIMNVFFNPSFVSQYKPSQEAKFVLDYINATGDKTVAPRYAPKTLDGIKLTGEQQSKMQRIMGEEVKKELAKISSTSSTNTERTKKKIDQILTDAGKKAREEIRKELK